MTTAKEYAKLSDSEKKKEDWMNNKWRPMMGWTYMLTCITDFVVFPVLWSLVQALGQGQVNMQWQPITLQGAGLFHIAMGAILGIAAYGRTQEKMSGANNGGLQNSGISTGGFNSGGFGAPSGGFSPGGFGGVSNSAPTGGFGGNTGFGGSTTYSQQVTTTVSGKKIIPIGDEPVL